MLYFLFSRFLIFFCWMSLMWQAQYIYRFSHVYCNWANRPFVSFVLTWICYQIWHIWRSNCEAEREEEIIVSPIKPQLMYHTSWTKRNPSKTWMIIIINQTGGLNTACHQACVLGCNSRSAGWDTTEGETPLWRPTGGLTFIFLFSSFITSFFYHLNRQIMWTGNESSRSVEG